MSLLQKIQSQLECPKEQYNDFSKYKYRSLEDIMEALKPILKEYEASLIITDEIVEISGRFYVKATANLLDSEAQIVGIGCAYAREPEKKKGMDEAQITGATSSYARKYACNGLFLIDDTKDPDTQDNRTHGKKITKPAPKPEPQGNTFEDDVPVAFEADMDTLYGDLMKEMDKFRTEDEAAIWLEQNKARCDQLNAKYRVKLQRQFSQIKNVLPKDAN